MRILMITHFYIDYLDEEGNDTITMDIIDDSTLAKSTLTLE